MSDIDLIHPDWPAPPRVRALVTTRAGGTSRGPYASLNLGGHVGDDPVHVAANRAALKRHLPDEPVWLEQVHGTEVISADVAYPAPPVADASVARKARRVCAVMTADCLPVLLCDRAGTVVAAAHAGWRGLAAGVLEETVKGMEVAPGELLAYLGPAIGPGAFEVGDDVRRVFAAQDPAADACFRPAAQGKFLADLYGLARRRLEAAGVGRVDGGTCCTVENAERFFSYRRDGVTGRMASLIWLE